MAPILLFRKSEYRFNTPIELTIGGTAKGSTKTKLIQRCQCGFLVCTISSTGNIKVILNNAPLIHNKKE